MAKSESRKPPKRDASGKFTKGGGGGPGRKKTTWQTTLARLATVPTAEETIHDAMNWQQTAAAMAAIATNSQFSEETKALVAAKIETKKAATVLLLGELRIAMKPPITEPA